MSSSEEVVVVVTPPPPPTNNNNDNNSSSNNNATAIVVPAGDPSARRATLCHGFCKNGAPCNRVGTYSKFHGRYCKQHVRQAAFQTECPICYDPMTEEDSVVMTCCGRAFHRACLKKQTEMVMMQCAICRARIDVDVLVDLHVDFAKNLTKGVFSLKDTGLITMAFAEMQGVVRRMHEHERRTTAAASSAPSNGGGIVSYGNNLMDEDDAADAIINNHNSSSYSRYQQALQ